jgi:L-asparaginase
MSIVTEEVEIQRTVKSADAVSRVTSQVSTAAQGQHIADSNVSAVFTGGTIAVSTNKTATVIPVLSGREILERVPEIRQYLPTMRVQVHDFATLPGPHISPEMMLTLTNFVHALAEHSDGVVITHGTDSMEECAYFLDLTIGDHVPIVFTGSMHPSTDAAWDGGRNLVDSLAVAASKEFRGMGAVVVMNGHVHAASEVTKTHTMRPDTFRSPDFGPLGTVNTLALDEPRRSREPRGRITIPLVNNDVELPYIELIKTYTGMDDMLFVAALKAGCAGIVVEAMGQGNVPPGVVNGISRAREMNIPVVITSRCMSGPVRPYYAYEGAGRELEKLGCLFAPYLNGQKARIKLIVAIGAGHSGEKLRELFPMA